MPRKSPVSIVLSPDERVELGSRARCYALPYRDVIWAKMVLLAAEGNGNDEIAARLASRREIVSKWRKRFFEQRLAGIEEHSRRGRPPVSSAGARGRGQGPRV